MSDVLGKALDCLEKVSDGLRKKLDGFGKVWDCLGKVLYGLRKVLDGLGKVPDGGIRWS